MALSVMEQKKIYRIFFSDNTRVRIFIVFVVTCGRSVVSSANKTDHHDILDHKPKPFKPTCIMIEIKPLIQILR
jgi:hypothetical protein